MKVRACPEASLHVAYKGQDWGLQEETTSRKRPIGGSNSHGAPRIKCATAKYSWRTIRCCAMAKDIAVAHGSTCYATANLGPERLGCPHILMAHHINLRHG